MPFVMRKVEPRHVCRGHVPAGPHPGWPVGAELEAVANGTLTTSLRQLASLLTVAEDIFANLTAELAQVAERSGHLRHKLDKVEERLCTVDPKKIPVQAAILSASLRHSCRYSSLLQCSTVKDSKIGAC
ncbi:WASF3 protein, partial [Acromyrmex insinuator]